jgi:hypothetical protein
VESQGLDIIRAHFIPNLRTVELKPWARRGGHGVYVNHEGSRHSNDCYVCEIAPGKSLAPQRQLFEEMVLVLNGRGSTSVWNDSGKRITFEWKAGRCSPFRSIAGTNISTAQARTPRAMWLSPTGRRS